ncbi:MAG: YhjD/YihY/BrkB family envelope integrity protein [Solirubrobacterales bacterium]
MSPDPRIERWKRAAITRAEASRFRAHLTRGADFGRRCLERLVEVEFVDRSIALASLTFTSLIPLGVVLGSVTPIDSEGFASSLIRRFHLDGTSAELVRSMFAPPSDVRSTVSVLGVALLVASALSFTRGLQRVYERSWRLKSLGVRATPAGLTWLLGVAVVVSIVVPLRHVIADATGPLLGLVVALTTELFVWLLTPFVLLSRRVPWRALVATAVLTAVVMDALSVASLVYMPRAIAESADRYGTIGIAIALMSWFVGAGFVLVACAAVGAVLGEGRAGPALSRVPRRSRLPSA